MSDSQQARIKHLLGEIDSKDHQMEQKQERIEVLEGLCKRQVDKIDVIIKEMEETKGQPGVALNRAMGLLSQIQHYLKIIGATPDPYVTCTQCGSGLMHVGSQTCPCRSKKGTVGELLKLLKNFPPKSKLRCHEKGGPYDTAPVGANLLEFKDRETDPGIVVLTLGPPKRDEEERA